MMDIRSREAALKKRNDELDACQTLYGPDNPIPSYIEGQTFESPLLSRQDIVQDSENSRSHTEQKESADNILPVSLHSELH